MPKHDFLAVLLEDPLAHADPTLMCNFLVVLLVSSRDNMQNPMGWSLHKLVRHSAWLECMREEAATQFPNGQRLHLKDMHVCMLYCPSHACTLTDHPAPQCFPMHLTIFHEMLCLWPGVPKNAHLTLHDDMLPMLSYPTIPIGVELQVSG